MAKIAAIKNVLSPSSETRIIKRDSTNPSAKTAAQGSGGPSSESVSLLSSVAFLMNADELDNSAWELSGGDNSAWELSGGA
jgi:hypothetical protein